MAQPTTAAKHEAIFTVEYPDDRTARIVAESIRPEVADLADDRSRSTVSRTGSVVTVHVTAGDPVALRAASNTWLSFVDVAERTVGTSRDSDPGS